MLSDRLMQELAGWLSTIIDPICVATNRQQTLTQQASGHSVKMSPGPAALQGKPPDPLL